MMKPHSYLDRYPLDDGWDTDGTQLPDRLDRCAGLIDQLRKALNPGDQARSAEPFDAQARALLREVWAMTAHAEDVAAEQDRCQIPIWSEEDEHGYLDAEPCRSVADPDLVERRSSQSGPTSCG